MKSLKHLSILLFLLAFSFVSFAQTKTIKREKINVNSKSKMDAEAKVESLSITTLKTEIIHVEGVTKGKDISAITNKLNAIDGVKNCRTTKKGTFHVTFDPQKVTKQKLKSTIERVPATINKKQRFFKVKE